MFSRKCAGLFLMLVSLPVFASVPAKDLTSISRDFMFEIVEVANFSKTKSGQISTESQNRVKSVSAKIDFVALAKKALTPKWSKYSETEKKDFLATLQELLEQVVYPKAKNINVQSDDLKFESVPGKKGRIKVTAEVEREKKGEMVTQNIEIELIYDLKISKITDAVVEGELISANLKRQFDEALKKKTFSQIIEQMKKRVDESKSPKTPS